MHFDWMLRLLIAAFCGGIIGYERNSHNKPSGVRTHAILALGSALAMIISQYGFEDAAKVDAARLAAQVVSGVGFLGAGIIFMRSGGVVGLTTAAGMWTTAIIGLAIGAGMLDLGIFSALMVCGIQLFFHSKVVRKRIKRDGHEIFDGDEEDEEE